MKNKVVIVIPAYNEGSSIGKVLDQLFAHGYHDVLVVNDGSKDHTAKIAHAKGVHLVSHIVNRGLGGALGTGIAGALMLDADYIVTFDADGQHDPEDIERVLAPLKSGKANVVIGSRLMNPEGMPTLRRLFNLIGNLVTWVLFGIYVTDSQSGLRAFTREAAQKLEIKTNRMEVSSEIIREIKQKGLHLLEVPIKAIYTSYSLSKGQNLLVGVKTFFKLVIHRLMP